MKVGILTGGGDAPGLNAVIRAVVKSASRQSMEIIGFDDGFRGLLELGRWRRLTCQHVSGIVREGGTILGTTNQVNPFSYPEHGQATDRGDECVERVRALELDALIVVGGDGTLAIAHRLSERGVPIVAVPKTIDNDVVETESSVGFDTAVSTATEAVDRLHTTAEAHHRIMVLEVMGRYSGWIALHAGLAGGADAILIPEIPYTLGSLAAHVVEREQLGATFSIIVAAEGARPRGGGHTVLEAGVEGRAERLGGIGAELAAALERQTGRQARSVLLGHLQRGGPPTSADRLLGARFGARAVSLVSARQFGMMVAFRPPHLDAVPLHLVVGRSKRVDPKSDTVEAARALGIAFGEPLPSTVAPRT
jgi:6-phosphofructokinase 1